ncbi:hypothetical protein GGF32_001354 [Allomyces javanicus]|nr:hypothetical protein GGF32_001354 [Allomyces javanicus]
MGNDMSSESAPHSRASTYEWVGHPPSFHQPAGSPPQPVPAPRGLQYPPLTDLHRSPQPVGGHKSPPPGTFPQAHPPLIDLAEPVAPMARERERPPIPNRPAVVPLAMWDTLAPAAALAKLRTAEPAARPAAAAPATAPTGDDDLLRVETELARAETDLSTARGAPLRINTTATARSPSPEVPSVPDVAANVDLASPMLSGPFSPYPTVEKERSISTVSVAGSATATAMRAGAPMSTAAEPATSTTSSSSRSPSPPSAAAAAAVPVTGSVLGLTPAAPRAGTPPRSPAMRPATAPVDRAPSLSLPPSASAIDPTSAAALLDANCTLTWQVRRARHAARRAASAAADLAALVREERRVDDALRDLAARQAELAERLFVLTAQRDRDRERAEYEQMAREGEAAARAFQRGGASDEQYGSGYVERGYLPDRDGPPRMQPYVRYVTPSAEWFVTQVDGRPERPRFAAR